MAIVRCTCIYRALPADTGGAHPSPFTEITRDPFCPSAELHDREARAAAEADQTRD